MYYADYFLCSNDSFYIEWTNLFTYKLEIRNPDSNTKQIKLLSLSVCSYGRWMCTTLSQDKRWLHILAVVYDDGIYWTKRNFRRFVEFIL